MPLRRAALGMCFVSATVLAFEVALTRICAALLQYHLSFAVVSMAVLGVGLGGFLAWLLEARSRGSDEVARAGGPTGIALVVLGPALVAALFVLLRLPFATRWPVLLFLVLPVFVAGGTFQSLVLRRYADRAGVLYAADLLGGAAGALLAVVGIDALGGPVDATLVLAVAAAGLAWLWTRGAGLAGRLAPVGFAVALAAVLGQAASGVLAIDWERAPHKLLSRMLQPGPQGTPRLVPRLGRWDATSRIDVLELDAPRGVQRLAFIDGETPTPLLQADPVAPNAAGVGIREALAALPCRLQPPRDVLSIGSGGGYDVVLARAFGAGRIDAVELNGGVLDVVAAARGFTGDVYGGQDVRLHHAEGRLFVRRAPAQSYDLVLLALAQSLVGNLQEYALSENYLYTREACADYLRVLRPDGTLAFLTSNAAVQMKLVHTALAVLAARGAPAAECVAAVTSAREGPYDHLVLVRPQPFSEADRTALAREVESRGYELVHAPGEAAPPGAASGRFAPASDERPFFFHLEAGTPAGLRTLLAIAGAALAAAFLVLAAVARRPAAGGSPAPGGALAAGGYFVLLGFAFLMVEVLVLQRTIRAVGFPTLNLGLVLATFLVAAGCGSAASARLASPRALSLLLLVLGAALLLLQPLLGALLPRLDGLPLAGRCAALVAVLFPFAFAMGMPFPAGVRQLPREARSLVPWLWGLNGVASIAGSALIVALVLRAGFTASGFLPAALYALAAALAPAPVSRR